MVALEPSSRLEITSALRATDGPSSGLECGAKFMKLRAAVGAAVPLRRWTAIMCTRQTPGNPSPSPTQRNQSADLHLPNPRLPRLLPKERAGAASARVDGITARDKGEIGSLAESVVAVQTGAAGHMEIECTPRPESETNPVRREKI
jgi:hypothetical protein